jgi:hypothetical protein
MMRLWAKSVVKREKERRERIKVLLKRRKALMQMREALTEMIAATAATAPATAAASDEGPPPGIGAFFEEYDANHARRVRLWLQNSDDPEAPDMFPIRRGEVVPEFEQARELRDRTTYMTRLGHRGFGG